MTLPAFQTASPAPPGEERDAREFEAFASEQDPLDIEAATWAARRRNGLDAVGAAGLQAWLDADPRHAGALQDMEDTLGAVEALPGGDVAALEATLPDRATPRPRPAVRNDPPWWGGWASMLPQAAMALLVVMVFGGGWIGWDQWRRQPTFTQDFATGRGQQLAVTLPDDAMAGSVLQLDTGTRVEARLYRDRRDVVLADGQAMFTVHADPSRPFHVRAGALRITVVGTRFSVRHTASGLDAGRTVVSVEEGRVRVSRVDAQGPGNSASDAAQASPVELTAGRMLSADADGRLGHATAIAPTAIAQWRTGRISFEHTPLAQALAEFERYGRTGLVVRDPAVAAMSIGGSYDLRQFQQFALTLPEVLPVRLEPRGDVLEIVAR